MLRVCGVTFDHTTNYGSCLQGYALKTVISQMTVGGEPCGYSILHSAGIRRREAAARKASGSVLHRIRTAGYNLIKQYRRKKFSGFEREHLRFTECRNRADLKELNREFDAFICGSDVIWNFAYTKGDTLFFLDFADKYRFSYAASLGKASLEAVREGVDLPEPAEAIYRRCISRLDGVSVREEYARELLAPYTDKTIEVTCDPTLLLTEEEWMKIADPEKNGKKYIFAYSTSTRPNFVSFLKKLSRQTGLPVVQVTWSAVDAIKQRSLTFPTPQRWLRLLHDAEYVVTNSFHGTAFSVLFHKTFFVAIQGERNVRNNVRLYDFLNTLKLESQLYSETPDTIPLTAPDYSFADGQIAAMREDSSGYIRRNLQVALDEKLTGKPTQTDGGVYNC